MTNGFVDIRHLSLCCAQRGTEAPFMIDGTAHLSLPAMTIWRYLEDPVKHASRRVTLRPSVSSLASQPPSI